MYLLCLNINISTVTCPGVWLCPKGEVILKVKTLQQTKKTRRAYPKFPITFVEKLSFQKLVVGGVESVAHLLDSEELQIELIQWIRFDSKLGVVLARFDQHLGSIFDPFVIGPGKVLVPSKTDLLMRRTEYFPGIISPKINAKFQLEIESCKSMENLYPLISSENCCESYLPRQRRVCHSASGYPYCSICSMYDICSSCSKLASSNACKYKSLCSFCNYSNEKLSSCCFCRPSSWCDYDEPEVKHCCCCKYHHIFY